MAKAKFVIGARGKYGDSPIIVDCDCPRKFWSAGRQCSCEADFLAKLTEIVNRELKK